METEEPPFNATEITQLLNQMRHGDPGVFNQFWEAVFPELRVFARRLLALEQPGHLLQPTALVNELWIQLRNKKLPVGNRNDFFGLARHLMKNALVDHARARNAQKRGGKADRVELDEDRLHTPGMDVDPSLIVEVDRALEKLRKADRGRSARVLELHYLHGKTFAEIGDELGISERTAKLDEKYARTKLRSELFNAAVRDS